MVSVSSSGQGGGRNVSLRMKARRGLRNERVMMGEGVALCAVRRTRFAHLAHFQLFFFCFRGDSKTRRKKKKKTNKGGGKCRCVMISRWYARCAVEVWGASGMRIISVTLTCSRVYTTSSCTPMSFSVQRVITRAGHKKIERVDDEHVAWRTSPSRVMPNTLEKNPSRGCRGASRLPAVTQLSSIESKRRCVRITGDR